MRHILRGAGVVLLPLALLACASEPTDPGAVSADEERQLNDAAAMLDANSVSVDDLADNGIDE